MCYLPIKEIWLFMITCATVIAVTYRSHYSKASGTHQATYSKSNKTKNHPYSGTGNTPISTNQNPAKYKMQSKKFEPESDSAIGQHLLESNQCTRNYSDSQFKILTTARSQFHLSLLEAVYISRKKTDLCRLKQFVFTLQLFR